MEGEQRGEGREEGSRGLDIYGRHGDKRLGDDTSGTH